MRVNKNTKNKEGDAMQFTKSKQNLKAGDWLERHWPMSEKLNQNLLNLNSVIKLSSIEIALLISS